MNEQEKDALNKSSRKAESILNDPVKTKLLLEQVVEKSDKNEGIFDNIWEDLQALIRMVQSWRSGKYTNVSKKAMLMVGGALLYLVNPLDLIPDFTPLLGMMDDVTVLGFVINSLRGEVKKFRAWEGAHLTVEFEDIEVEDIEVEEVA